MNFRTVKLRSFNDFFGQANKFAVPNFQDDKKFVNRVKCNLLYYQANYFFLFIAMMVPMILFNQQAFFVSTSFILLSLLAVIDFYLEIVNIQRIRIVLYLLSFGILVFYTTSFLIGLAYFLVPVPIMLLHSMFRLRNLKNKINSNLEKLDQSPMGLLLSLLGFTDNEEIFDNCFDSIANEGGVRFVLPKCLKHVYYVHKCSFCYQNDELCYDGSFDNCENYIINETVMLPPNSVNPLREVTMYNYRKGLVLMGIITIAVLSLLVWCLYICFVLYMGGHYAGYYSDLAQEYATIISL